MVDDKIFWFDVETSGTDSNKHGIIQIAGMIEVAGEVKETFEFLVEQDESLDFDHGTTDVHGYSEDVMIEEEKFKSESQVFDELTGIMGNHVDAGKFEDGYHVGGYNVNFDIGFLSAFWDRNSSVNIFSYLSLNKVLDPYFIFHFLEHAGKINYQFNSRKLEKVCQFFTIEPSGDWHDAMADVVATRELYYELLDRIESNGEKTQELQHTGEQDDIPF